MATPADEAPPPDGTPPLNGSPPPDGHHPYPFFYYPYCVTCQQQVTKKVEPIPQSQPDIKWLPIAFALVIGGIIGYAIAKR